MHTYLIFCHSSNVLFAIFGCKCLLKQVLVNFKFSLMLISQGLSGKLLVTVNQHQTWINFGCPYISWSRSVHIIRGLYRIYQKKRIEIRTYLPEKIVYTVQKKLWKSGWLKAFLLLSAKYLVQLLWTTNMNYEYNKFLVFLIFNFFTRKSLQIAQKKFLLGCQRFFRK